VLAICAVPRIAAIFAWRDVPATHYSAIAESLADSGRYVLDGLLATHIEPLCPAVFAAGRMMFGHSLTAMLVLPLATAVVAGVALFVMTRRKLASDHAAWIATLLYAFSPYLVRQSASLMEVTLATAVLIVAAWSVERVATVAGAATAGALLGAAVLTRFSFLPIAIGGVWVVHRRGGAARAAVAAAVAAVCVAPWMAYSYAAGGAALPARIGENLFESTNEWSTVVTPRVNVDVLASVADDVARDRLAREGITTYGMAARDRALVDYVREYVRAHPIETIGLKLRNLAFALQPRLLPFTERVGTASIVDGGLVLPEQRRRPIAYDVLGGAFQGVLLLGAAAGLWTRRGRASEDSFLLIVLTGVLSVAVVFYPTSRLLAPATFVLMFYTAAWPDRSRGRIVGR